MPERETSASLNPIDSARTREVEMGEGQDPYGVAVFCILVVEVARDERARLSMS